MTFDAHANLAITTVAIGPSPLTSGTSLTVAAGTGSLFPAAPFNATAWPPNVAPLPLNAEIVRVTAVVSDALTITRAQEGTSAQPITVGWQIANTITAKDLTDIETGITTGSALPSSVVNGTQVSGGSMGATYTFVMAKNRVTLLDGTLTANLTITVSPIVAGGVGIFKLTQDTIGGRTVTVTDGSSSVVAPIPPWTGALAQLTITSTDGTNVDVAVEA